MSIPSPQPGGNGSRPGVPAADPVHASPGEVAALIEEILGIGQVATDDNFFEVGGSSILALMLISKIEERWAATLSLIDVIRNATPSLLADLIAKVAPSDSGASR